MKSLWIAACLAMVCLGAGAPQEKRTYTEAFEQGAKCYKARKYAEAAKEFSAAVKLAGSDLEKSKAYLHRGLANYKLHEWEPAKEAFAAALEIERAAAAANKGAVPAPPNCDRCHEGKGRKAADLAYDAGEHWLCMKCHTGRPRGRTGLTSGALLQSGCLSCHEGPKGETYRKFREVLDVKNGYALHKTKAQLKIGQCYLRDGKHQEAREAYGKVPKIKDASEADVRQVQTRLEDCRLAEALAALVKAGRDRLEAKDYDAAAAAYRRAIEAIEALPATTRHELKRNVLPIYTAESHYSVGLCHRAAGHAAEAAEEFKKTLAVKNVPADLKTKAEAMLKELEGKGLPSTSPDK